MDHVWVGVGLMFALPIAALFAIGIVLTALQRLLPHAFNNEFEFGFIFLAVPGLTQLLYALPLIWWARRTSQHNLLRGLVIGAALIFLLNATCLGLVTSGFRNGFR